MNFDELATAYESSESETDKEPATSKATDVGSEITKEPKRDRSDHTETHRAHKEKVAQLIAQPSFSGDVASVSMLPPPPTVLLEGDDNIRRPACMLRAPDTVSQPASKRRKIEGRVEAVRKGLFLPRQVQTQVPNVSTEDLQSYGMKP